MTTPEPESPWNTHARISCEFSFKCPKHWDRLPPTAIEGVRHCAACDRDVHLALTEEHFRRHAEDGHCVAVRVLLPDTLGGTESAYIVGSVVTPYEPHLKKV